LRKRGPDDEGLCLVSRENGEVRFYHTGNTARELADSTGNINDKAAILYHDVAFFHTRYSIIDLSEKGHQPFLSADGNIVGVFNGEIYNYVELREELSSCGVRFRTDSDTEVLIEGYNYWGEKLWSRMNGFWAFCLYDFRDKTLVLSRDRIGVAPLYLYETAEALVFSSYMEPLINISEGKCAVDRDVVMGFIQTGIKDHGNTTFYSGIKSLPSASIIRLNYSDFSIKHAPVRKYWALPRHRLEEKDISFKDAVDDFRALFFDAVKIRMRADVRIAFELSGGLDSSSVTAVAARLSDEKITTFTAKIKEADEEPFARSMLSVYDIDYNVVKNIEDDFTEDYGNFSRLMEEPYDSPNDYTHYRMLREIKNSGGHVIITGAGGDEVFAGYESSFWAKAYREMKKNGITDYLRADWYEFSRRFKTVGSTVDMFKHYCSAPLKIMLSKFTPDTEQGEKIYKTTAALLRRKYRNLPFHEATLYHFNTALIPYYMRSSDHFTMGIPIEHRFPFLDYRIVEFGLKLPPSYLFRNGWSKYILRKAMEPYLPAKIVWRRKKMGFTFPYRNYFKRHKTVFKPVLADLQGKRFV
jgi:asparagine synthase (glutamine-hydrolysing)